MMLLQLLMRMKILKRNLKVSWKTLKKLLDSWLKKIKSKKYKKHEIDSDDVYQAFNNVLAEDDVNLKNVNKRVQQEMKGLVD